jgi:peptide methionine sulfoxide reductase MsrB
MNFFVCSYCDGSGWVPVYSNRSIHRIRKGQEWNHVRTFAACTCEPGERHLAHFEKQGHRPATYDPKRFCLDVSAGWKRNLNLAPADGRKEMKRQHEKHVRDWLASRGTEFVGTFSMDEWGANHGG